MEASNKSEDDWFTPAGLYPDSTREMSNRALDKLNVKRLHLMLLDNRTFPVGSGLKLTRRSRRRWRGKGGLWQYPANLLVAYETALDLYLKKGY